VFAATALMNVVVVVLALFVLRPLRSRQMGRVEPVHERERLERAA
jgi:hypothetical protein